MDIKNLYNVVKSGNTQEVNKLIENDVNNAKFLARCLEDLTIKRVQISDEMHKFCIGYFAQFKQVIEISANKDKINYAHKELLSTLIDEATQTPIVDIVLFQLYKHIYRNIYILKNQLLQTYDSIPWEEIEFLLTIYVYAQTKDESLGKYFILSFNKSKINNYLSLFINKLHHTPLSTGRMLPQERNVVVQTLKLYFEDLYDNFDLMRTVYSLAHIYESLLILNDIDIYDKKGKCAIRRLLQITGEFCKNTLQSPNFHDEIFEINTLRHNHKLQEIFKSFKKLRDSLSHFSTSSTIDIDYVLMHSQLQYFADMIEFMLIAKRYEIVANTQPVILVETILNQIYECEQLPIVTIESIILNCNNEDVVAKMYFLFEYIVKDKDTSEIKEFLKNLHKIIYNPKVKHNPQVQKVIYNIIDQATDFNIVKKCNETSSRRRSSEKPHTDDIKFAIIKDIISGSDYTMYLKSALENITFDLLDVSTNGTYDNRYYLDQNYPLVFDRALRNQIAHDNLILVECSTAVSIYITAQKFADGTMHHRRIHRTDFELKSYFDEIEERYNVSKDILQTQNNFYEACKNGTIDKVAESINNGADPDGRNVQGLSALHIAILEDNDIVFDYIRNINLQQDDASSSNIN